MPFKPGESGNPQGRPFGKKNRTTNEIKEMINQFISCNLDDLQKNYDCLDAEKKLQFFEKLLKFVIPAQNANDININALSESEMDLLIERITNNLK